METYGYNTPEQNNQHKNTDYRSEKKLTAGILAILLGALGVHKFYLGYANEGGILLISTLIIIPVLTIITCGIASFIYPLVFVVPFIEGIIYLTMSDEQFDRTYVQDRKPWF
jgi:TM2 domain-containing membrane protein YozV